MYKIIRSKRKTIAIKVCDDGSVIIKAPRFASKAQIYSFINTKTDWIKKNTEKGQRTRRAPCNSRKAYGNRTQRVGRRGKRTYTGTCGIFCARRRR